jgi:hypothetical protein
MPRPLNTFQQIPAHTQTVTLGDTVYRLRLIWRDRLDAWYADLFEQDGTPIRTGKRVSAEWVLFHGEMEAKEDGMIYVYGPDDYDRNDLGENLLILYVPKDEILEAI